MPLAEDRQEGLYTIRWVSAEAIRIDDAEFSRSLLLLPDQVHRDLDVQSLDAIDEALVKRILDLAPQVLILGTGQRQVFPPPRLMAAFLSRGVGIEAMDNAAAARTYNLLALEGRRVAGLFLMGQG
ncbi:MAG: hypothetical protein H4O13_07890 [Xanthomonadales bacterium]|nr:hypothetical protein [Xanthomonadales bacterium]